MPLYVTKAKRYDYSSQPLVNNPNKPFSLTHDQFPLSNFTLYYLAIYIYVFTL